MFLGVFKEFEERLSRVSAGFSMIAGSFQRILMSSGSGSADLRRFMGRFSGFSGISKGCFIRISGQFWFPLLALEPV